VPDTIPVDEDVAHGIPLARERSHDGMPRPERYLVLARRAAAQDAYDRASHMH
jgi:hypothetical protein